MARTVPEWIGRTDDAKVRVASALVYDEDTGALTWRSRVDRGRTWNTRFSGKVAGSIDAHGYRIITLDGMSHKAHRLAWLLAYGAWPEGDIDHVNRNRSDNRLANLRQCSRAENMQNQSLRSDSTTGFTGVSFCKQTGRWRAKIRVDGDQIHLGRFDTPEQARDAYLIAKAGVHDFHPILEGEGDAANRP